MVADAPFTIDVADTVLDDLRVRLRATRWPDQLDDTTWEHGADLAYLRDLVHTWTDEFDWRAHETAINAELPGRRCRIGDLDIHYVRMVPQTRSDRLPVLLLHGWPSSFLEMRTLAQLLLGAGHEVIVPSLPGHGFSSIPQRTGFGADACAEVLVRLMTEVVGHTRVVVHGGDRGAFVATSMAILSPAHVAGIHLSLPGGIAGDGDARTIEEAQWLTDTSAWAVEEGGYSAIQSTKPQTLAYAMHDSPVGTLAWLVEKHRTWTDCDGDIERVFTRDQLLLNAMVYWVTGTFRSAAHWYWEHRVQPPASMRTGRAEVPTAVIRYPKEVYRPPRSAVERKYRLVRWTERPRGGHFPAYEDPVALANDVMAFASDL